MIATDTPRASLAETRNPLLALPAARRLGELDPATRDLVAELLGELALDARGRAEQSWRKHKAPMAAYWKAVAVYARHLRLVLRQERTADQEAAAGAGAASDRAEASAAYQRKRTVEADRIEAGVGVYTAEEIAAHEAEIEAEEAEEAARTAKGGAL